jgi:hypothetical protein
MNKYKITDDKKYNIDQKEMVRPTNIKTEKD